MHPELFTLFGGLSVKTYGFCMMVGFLTAVWFAMRRATRVKANADRVLDISFLCLLFGVGGARIFYVIHYWNPQFATAQNKLLAIVDITGGGLEFLGGFLGAVVAVTVYCAWTKVSLRLYLDILAPSCLWGLAFGRLGCFFNGCCFGGLCVVGAASGDAHTKHAAHQWAVQFPFGSSAHARHWEDREITLPAELILTNENLYLTAPIPADQLAMSVEKREGPLREYETALTALKKAKEEDAESDRTKKLTLEVKRLRDIALAHQRKIGASLRAQQFPSRVAPTRKTSLTELQDLASTSRSSAVHPTQLYSAIQALLLSFVLSAVFYRRKRHGVVIGLLILMYPIQRTILELIRADNPHDVAGLTVSQGVSVALFLAAIGYFLVLYKVMPERSPYAVKEIVPDSK
jgi:phosphatidylglycerol---prolipoprotein diacylglyceryl transferase